MVRKCKHCLKEFSEAEMNGKQFSNHVRWCSYKNSQDGKDRLKSYKEKVKGKIKENTNKRLGAKKEYTVKCNKCGKEFKVQEYENKFPSKEKYFCSRKCANSRQHNEETKQKIKSGIYSFYNKNDINPKFLYEKINNKKVIIRTDNCIVCGKKIPNGRNRKSKTCSNECSKQLMLLKKYNGEIPEKTLIHQYRNKCAFKFALSDYPNEFDFDLIKKYGWYSPDTNTSGISRDHCYSVMEGYRNKVDPQLLAHPANCKLMIHNKNISKKDKSSITLSELKERIKKWNDKYK